MRPILYIHGFASSGHSTKAQLLRRALPQVYTPSLPYVPQLAVETLGEWLNALGAPLLVGSSLGGYYALHLAARHGLPAVLINPALTPRRTLAGLTGLLPHYFDQSRFELLPAHLDYLDQLLPPDPPLDRLLLLVELGDELIDQRESLRLLAGARTVVSEGGNHGYAGLAAQLPAIAAMAAEA